MNWRRAVTRYWQYKVAALFVAVLLWVTVTTDEQQEQPVSTRVNWQVRDSSYVLVEAPGQVSTVFQARMGELMSFVGNAPVLRYPIDSVTGPRMRISLNADMVEYGQVGSARPVAVRPSDVVLEFEPRVRRRVPVAPATEVTAADGWAVVDSPTVEPESVTVSGAESEVEELEEVRTESAVFDEVRGRIRRDVPVRLPDEAPNVRADPAIVLVTVEADSVATRRLRRAVGTRGVEAGAVVLEPDSATVVLRGPVDAVEGLPGDSVSVLADVSDGLDGGGSFDLLVRLPARPGLRATVEPTEVRVRPAERP